jgi:hypothetical protein
MPRVCSVCTSGARERIDADLVAGEESLKKIAALYCVSTHALGRHKARHLPGALVKAQEAQEVTRGDDLLDKVAQLEADAHRIKQKAEESQDYRTALQGIRELVRIVELLARLRGELQEAPVINLLVSPEWLTVRAALLAALLPYPEARIAVAERLLALEVPSVGK